MSVDLLPSDLGFPSHTFTAWRDGQLEAAIELAESTERFCLLRSPTGAGKSLTYLAASRLAESRRTLVLVGTRQLQDQLLKDFGPAGMVAMKGRANYECVGYRPGGEWHMVRPAGSDCSDAPCTDGERCGHKEGAYGERGDIPRCLYFARRDLCASSPLVVTNYAYWFSLARSGQPHALGHFDCLVVDEAHGVDQWLTRFAQIQVSKERAWADLKENVPSPGSSIADWREWARAAAERIPPLTPQTSNREKKVYRRWLDRLKRLSRIKDSWVVSVGRMKGRSTTTFRPLWVKDLGEPYLFRGVKRVILSSATVTAKDAQLLGAPPGEVFALDSGKGFPPARRPFIVVEGAPKVKHGMEAADERRWVDLIDEIIRPRAGRKGVIHTRSYSRASQVQRLSKLGHLMIVPQPGDMRLALDRFRQQESGCVLVAPAIEEGVDFPYDEARWQIIAKVPFLNPTDPWTQARMKADRQWADTVVARTVCQIAGRVVRAKDDWGETIVVDGSFGWLSARAGKRGLWPGWFVSAWRRKAGVPEAMKARK